MSVSDEILTRMADSYRRIRNTTRYLLANVSDYEVSNAIPVSEMLTLDQWAVARAHDLQKEILAAYEDFQFHLIYQKLHNFCVVDMGGFYLDVLKDRMYTMPTHSRGRRSAQSAMWHILEALVRWLAPILTFTAEEIWRYMPGQRSESVLLDLWHKLPELSEGIVDLKFWEEMLAVRQAVAKELEKLRIQGDIGSGLNAEVDLYADAHWQKHLSRLGDELRFVFITSYARVHDLSDKPNDAVDTEIKGLAVRVVASTHPKCIRCWHYREDIGSNPEHPEICVRCIQNVTGPGEERSHA